MDRLQKLLALIENLDSVGGSVDRSLQADLSEEVERINTNAVRRLRRAEDSRAPVMLRFPQTDLVQYRLQRSSADHYAAATVAGSMVAFQELFTAVFDAIRSAPKQRYQPSPENVVLSTMDIARVIPGDSVLVLMSMASERMLAIKKDLDRTFEGVFQILNIRTREEIADLASRFGVASLSKAHGWASNAARFGLTTSISVQRSVGAEPMSVMLSNSEAQALKEIIEEESVTKLRAETAVGWLLGIDVDDDPSHSHFHIKTEDGRVIRGKLTASFPRQSQLSLYTLYQARLFKATTVRFATADGTVDWLLESLEPLEFENGEQA